MWLGCRRVLEGLHVPTLIGKINNKGEGRRKRVLFPLSPFFLSDCLIVLDSKTLISRLTWLSWQVFISLVLREKQVVTNLVALSLARQVHFDINFHKGRLVDKFLVVASRVSWNCIAIAGFRLYRDIPSVQQLSSSSRESIYFSSLGTCS